MVVIRVDFARARISDSARTEEFENEIEKLRDALAFTPGRLDERPRYSPRTIGLLTRDLMARGPGLRDAIFQLAHLLRAAAAVAPSGSALEVLFTLEGPARPDPLARGLGPWFEGRAEIGTIRDDLLALPYDGAGAAPYEIPFRRMPLVLALHEFVLGLALEGEAAAERDAALEAAATAENTRAAISAASNRLANAISRYLDTVLGGRAAQERLRAITRLLDEEAEAPEHGGPPIWHIDDAAVLSFWETEAAKSGAEGGELRMFVTAHRSFVALLVALREGEGWYAMHQGAQVVEALPLGQDINEDEVIGLGDVAGCLFPGGPIERLAEPPADAVKVLNKREAETLELVDSFWRLAPELPLSTLRSAVMGGHQSAIRAALQFKRPIAPLLELAPGPATGPATGSVAGGAAEGGRYAEQAAAWRDAKQHLGRMRLAAAHVLAHHAGLEVPGDAAAARKAFRGFRREGFQDALEDPDRGEAFGATIAPLTTLSSLAESLLAALPEDLDGLYAADRPRFQAMFRAIYGEPEDA